MAGPLEHGPVARPVAGEEDQVMTEDRGSQGEGRQADEVAAPAFGHPETVANQSGLVMREPSERARRPGDMYLRLCELRPAIAAIGLSIIIAACSAAPGSSGGVADASAAATRALAQDSRFIGVGAYDASAIGQAAWYKVTETVDGWAVTIRIGWGDCPAGCISEHIWTFNVARGGHVVATGERGDPLPNAQAVAGRAAAGPTCPVERNPPDPACADRPVAGAVIMIQNAAGAGVAQVTTAADGSFSLMLAPGAYRLVPQPVSGLMGTASPVDFQVEAGKAAPPLQVSYDTGIR